ncbi:flavodoxin family protein [Lactobacillus helveticus]|uniref:flavodoxin family protein n=1 Tax=Lactobacillus helveticus TaxID=1587 RepID=UPI00156290CA|nr:flavodoxin [Lactobacillus helveticus]NRO03296.1 NAD(P)H dehydrogenase (quinone) [Lactobacillus helveticus]NRO38778.1 NAD(P)H dehydrogenase (quinone) [Lactobacillus helveticus]
MAKNTLILYYSWSGNTKKLAEKIHDQIEDSDLKAVEVADGTFDDDQYKTNDIALDQIQANSFPDIKLDNVDFNKYDLILIGSPVWSGYPVTPIKTLLDQMQGYNGEVASFYTSAGANRKAYVNHFKEWANDLNVAENDSKIDEWVK